MIYGREEFFNATKLMHNALQGAPQDLDAEQWATWRKYNEINARELSGGWNVCLVHDPEPAALCQLAPEKAQAGLALPYRPVDPNATRSRNCSPYLQHYPQSLFHMAEYVPTGMRAKSTWCPPRSTR